MVRLLLDSSVWLAWLRSEEEPNHAAAHSLIQRAGRGDVEVRLLDLTPYEIGNVIIRAWGQPGTRADESLARALTVAGARPLVPTPEERQAAHALADQHRLSVYDATYAAVARSRRMTLVSGDRKLVDAGLAVLPADA